MVKLALLCAMMGLFAGHANAQAGPPTAPPTAPPVFVGMRVVSGSQYCSVSGMCATEGAGNHGNNERCTIELLTGGTLSSTEFSTESCCDRVTIAGQQFQGTTGPRNVEVTYGDTFSWQTDHSVVGSGWTICLTPSGGANGPGGMRFDTTQPATPEVESIQRIQDYVLPGSAPYTELVPYTGDPASPEFAGSRLMTLRTQQMLRGLSNEAAARFPGYTLRVLAAWTARPASLDPLSLPAPTALNTGQAVRLELVHASNGSFAVNMTGRLGSAASAAGFDWVAYIDPAFIYAAVRPDSCQNSVDLLFLLDGSASMDGFFPGEISFARQIIEQFNVGANSTRVAALTYSSSATVNFDFLGEFEGDQEIWYYEFGQADIACGEFRASVTTAGQRATWTFVAPNSTGSVTFSSCATLGDTVMYVDGGSRIDEDSCELNEQQTRSYTANQRISISVGWFSSSSSGPLRLDAVCNGAAIVIPSRSSTDVSQLARRAVLARVDGITQPGGSTNTALALERARSLFSADSGARPISQGIPRICLLVTDGDSTSMTSTIAAAAVLKNDNVAIFAIGAGDINQTELRGVASTPIDDHLFLIGSAGDIPTLVDRMAETTCGEPAQVPACGQIIDEVNAGEFKFFRPLGNGLTENIVLEVIDRSGDGVSVFVSGSDPNPGPYHNDIADDSRSTTKLITASPETLNGSSLYVSVRGNGNDRSQFMLDVYNDLFPNNNSFEVPVANGLPAGTVVFNPPLPSSPLIVDEVLRYRLTAFSRWFDIDSATGQIRTLRTLDYDTEADLSVIIAATAAASSQACVQGAILVRILVTPPPSTNPPTEPLTTLPPTSPPTTLPPTNPPTTLPPTNPPSTTVPTVDSETFSPTLGPSPSPTDSPVSLSPTVPPTSPPTVPPTNPPTILPPTNPPSTPPPSQAPTTAGPTAVDETFSPTSTPTLEPETPASSTTTTTQFIPTIAICLASDVDDCALGAECVVTELGTHCVCENGNVISASSGLCDVPICDALPCFNGGVCAADRDSPVGFQCGCAAGLVQPQCGPGAPELSFFYYYPQLDDNSIEVPSTTGPGTVLAVAAATVATGNIRFSLSGASERRRRNTDVFPVHIDPVTGEISLVRTVTEATLTMTVNAISRFGALENSTMTELRVTIVVPTTESTLVVIDSDASGANEDNATASGTWWVIMLIVLLIILCVGLAAFVLWRKNSGADNRDRKNPGVYNPLYGHVQPAAPDDGGGDVYDTAVDTADPVYGEVGDTTALADCAYGETEQQQSRAGATVNTAYVAVEPDAGGEALYDSAGDAPIPPAIYHSAAGSQLGRSDSVYNGFVDEAPVYNVGSSYTYVVPTTDTAHQQPIYDQGSSYTDVVPAPDTANQGSSYTDVVPTPDTANQQPIYDQAYGSEQPTYDVGSSCTGVSLTPPAGNEAGAPIYDMGAIGSTDSDAAPDAPTYDIGAAQDSSLYATAAVVYDNEDTSVDPAAVYDTASAVVPVPAASPYATATANEGYLTIGSEV